LIQQQALELKTQVLAFGPDVEKEVAGRGRGGVLGALDGREGPQLSRAVVN